MPAVQYSELANAGVKKETLESCPVEMESTVNEIPSVINGERIRTDHKGQKVNLWDR
ncbi:hypothetical protein AFLA70_292g001400 [Aspergillus flavus AF70]|nr:hypothetical protein AFLA70_292g001400 [Aspergillus flavus AF70]